MGLHVRDCTAKSLLWALAFTITRDSKAPMRPFIAARLRSEVFLRFYSQKSSPHSIWEQFVARFSRRGVRVAENLKRFRDLYGKKVRHAQSHTNHKPVLAVLAILWENQKSTKLNETHLLKFFKGLWHLYYQGYSSDIFLSSYFIHRSSMSRFNKDFAR